MKFEEVLPALREGKKIRRNNPSWLNSINYIFLGRDIYGAPKIRLKYLEGGPEIYIICSSDLRTDDWEIVKEPKKVKLRDLTEEQYKKWFKNNCPKYDDDCRGCPFKKVKCVNREKENDGWYLNKDLYSDKFLDQEIEIDEE